MQDAVYHAQIRNGWLLCLVLFLFVGVFGAYAYWRNEPALEPEWDMGHRPFVPGEGPYAKPYPVVEAPPADATTGIPQRTEASE